MNYRELAEDICEIVVQHLDIWTERDDRGSVPQYSVTRDGIDRIEEKLKEALDD